MDKRERKKLENLYDDFVELCDKYSVADVLVTWTFFLNGLIRMTKDIGVTIEDLQKEIAFTALEQKKDLKNLSDSEQL